MDSNRFESTSLSLTLRNAVRSGILVCVLRFPVAVVLILSLSICANADIVIGPGTGFNSGGDIGTPTNVDRLKPIDLVAGVYDVTSFDVQTAGADGNSSVVPFLATGSSNNFTVIWVGPGFTPTVDGIHHVDYSPSAAFQFELTGSETVYAGVDMDGGPLVTFSNGGLTDHDTTPGFGTISKNQHLTGFSSLDINRTYSFALSVSAVPEPSSITICGLAGLVGLVRLRRRIRS